MQRRLGQSEDENLCVFRGQKLAEYRTAVSVLEGKTTVIEKATFLRIFLRGLDPKTATEQGGFSGTSKRMNIIVESTHSTVPYDVSDIVRSILDTCVRCLFRVFVILDVDSYLPPEAGEQTLEEYLKSIDPNVEVVDSTQHSPEEVIQEIHRRIQQNRSLMGLT